MLIPQVPIQLLVDGESDPTSAQLHILGNITKGHWLLGKTDSDTDASDIAQALKDLPKSISQIVVHINSYGGEVAEGIAIYNALKSHPAQVTTVCEGMACSIASVIFMAGDKRIMRPASLLMLHNASMPARGDANAMRKAAQTLDAVTDLSKRAYLEHATDALSADKLTQIMDEETWVKPEQAVEWGLATEIDAPDPTDEPSQSVEQQVMEALTRQVSPKTVTVKVAPVQLTEEQFEEIVSRTLLRMGEHAVQPIAEQYATDSIPTPDPTPTLFERYSRLFEQIANMKEA